MKIYYYQQSGDAKMPYLAHATDCLGRVTCKCIMNNHEKQHCDKENAKSAKSNF